MPAPNIWTLEKRLGYGLVAMLQADAGMFNQIFGDRVEFAQDFVEVDSGQGPTVLIKPDLPQDPLAKGENWAHATFQFIVVIRNWDDRQQNRALAEAYQTLDAALVDEAAYFEDYVDDQEENLTSKCGKLEIRHELNTEDLNDMPVRQARILITVMHKRPLTYSNA